MPFDITERTPLRHNPTNKVTAAIERVRDANGHTMIRKELRPPDAYADDADRWAASADPKHWNYWRREAASYQGQELRRSLTDTGLDLPDCQVVEHDEGATAWLRLLAHRDELLTVMERLPRTRSHLDVWVSNQIRRPTGDVVLVDWAFAGDGAIGEDLGNHIPDATFDLFWPSEDIGELEAACFDAYDTQRAYHQPADAQELYRRRGLTFAHLVEWCDEALARIGR